MYRFTCGFPPAATKVLAFQRHGHSCGGGAPPPPLVFMQLLLGLRKEKKRVATFKGALQLLMNRYG